MLESIPSLKCGLLCLRELKYSLQAKLRRVLECSIYFNSEWAFFRRLWISPNFIGTEKYHVLEPLKHAIIIHEHPKIKKKSFYSVFSSFILTLIILKPLKQTFWFLTSCNFPCSLKNIMLWYIREKFCPLWQFCRKIWMIYLVIQNSWKLLCQKYV